MESNLYDVAICGAGAGGLSASIFCRMREMKTLLLDLKSGGGQMLSIYPAKPVRDYPAYPEIPARELALNMIRQTKSMGIKICKNERLQDITKSDDIFSILTTKNSYKTKTVILAMGAGIYNPRKLGIIGEEDFCGKGVTYGIPSIKETREKKIICVGGGNSSLETALTVKDFAESVTIVHRSNTLEAYEFYIDAVKDSCVKVLYDSELKEVMGNDSVKEAIIYDKKSDDYNKVEADIIIINVGSVPYFQKIQKWGIGVDKSGVTVDREMNTSVPGIYACGDMVSYRGKLKLLISASGEGSIAAESAFKYTKEHFS